MCIRVDRVQKHFSKPSGFTMKHCRDLLSKHLFLHPFIFNSIPFWQKKRRNRVIPGTNVLSLLKIDPIQFGMYCKLGGVLSFLRLRIRFLALKLPKKKETYSANHFSTHFFAMASPTVCCIKYGVTPPTVKHTTETVHCIRILVYGIQCWCKYTNTICGISAICSTAE